MISCVLWTHFVPVQLLTMHCPKHLTLLASAHHHMRRYEHHIQHGWIAHITSGLCFGNAASLLFSRVNAVVRSTTLKHKCSFIPFYHVSRLFSVWCVLYVSILFVFAHCFSSYFLLKKSFFRLVRCAPVFSVLCTYNLEIGFSVISEISKHERKNSVSFDVVCLIVFYLYQPPSYGNRNPILNINNENTKKRRNFNQSKTKRNKHK